MGRCRRRRPGAPRPRGVSHAPVDAPGVTPTPRLLWALLPRAGVGRVRPGPCGRFSAGGPHGASTSVRFRGSGIRGHVARDVLRIQEDVWVVFPQVTSIRPVPSNLPAQVRCHTTGMWPSRLGTVSHGWPLSGRPRQREVTPQPCPALWVWGPCGEIQHSYSNVGPAACKPSPCGALFAVRSDVSPPDGGASPGPWDPGKGSGSAA